MLYSSPSPSHVRRTFKCWEKSGKLRGSLSGTLIILLTREGPTITILGGNSRSNMHDMRRQNAPLPWRRRYACAPAAGPLRPRDVDEFFFAGDCLLRLRLSHSTSAATCRHAPASGSARVVVRADYAAAFLSSSRRNPLRHPHAMGTLAGRHVSRKGTLANPLSWMSPDWSTSTARVTCVSPDVTGYYYVRPNSSSLVTDHCGRGVQSPSHVNLHL